MAGHKRLAYCGKSDALVAKLVAGPRLNVIGPRVYICDLWAALAIRIMKGSAGDGHACLSAQRSRMSRAASHSRAASAPFACWTKSASGG